MKSHWGPNLFISGRTSMIVITVFWKSKDPSGYGDQKNLTEVLTFGLDLNVHIRFWQSGWQRKDGTGKTHGSRNTQNFKGIESISLE